MRVRVVISGRVQGVCFRQSALEEATRLGLAGWVRNRPDGTVEAEVEGAPEAVEVFVAFCRRGPDGARVDGVSRSERPPRGEVGFRVERSG